MKQDKVLISIPAFNEEDNIRLTIEKVKEVCKGKGYEIVVVNDGSKDRTAIRAAKSGATVISHPFNMGYGVAIQTGYKYALENDFDLLVQIDADGQHDPKYILKMLNTLRQPGVDGVIGSRFKVETGYKAPIIRKIGMIFFNFLVNLITGKRFTDCTSGYQAYHKKILKFLTSDLFPCDYPDADLIIMLYFSGFNLVEIPMKMQENATGKSMHGSLRKNFYYVAKMCLSIFTIMLRRITGLATQ
ncbi:MAG: glycosyltransferase family 2 protein [Candidatus Shapirobacteria bacterium]|jgi:hypothetical protein